MAAKLASLMVGIFVLTMILSVIDAHEWPPTWLSVTGPKVEVVSQSLDLSKSTEKGVPSQSVDLIWRNIT